MHHADEAVAHIHPASSATWGASRVDGCLCAANMSLVFDSKAPGNACSWDMRGVDR